MLQLDDLGISLVVLVAIRVFGALSFLEMLFREKKLRYLILSIGWTLYALGPLFALYLYQAQGRVDHPVFNYLIAAGTFFIIFGLLLYYFRASPTTVLGWFIFFSLLVSLLFLLAPDFSGTSTILAQTLLLVITAAIVLFKLNWIVQAAGIVSYIWIVLCLIVSISSAAFHLTHAHLAFSLRFLTTFITNLFLLMAFLHFDRERSVRKIKRHRKEIANTLLEKETLLKEVHHRVKNNIAIMSSLLFLQSKNIDNKLVFDELTKAQNRIKAMALVHKKLFESTSISHIHFHEYIDSLISSIKNGAYDDVDFSLDLAEIDIEPDTLILCGLIINEIVTNSIQHAFDNSQDKCIALETKLKQADKISITISDNGKGLPERSLQEEGTTVGLSLVKSLIQQLHGTMKVRNKNGTIFNFLVPCKTR